MSDGAIFLLGFLFGAYLVGFIWLFYAVVIRGEY